MKIIDCVYPMLQQTLIQHQDQLKTIKEKQEGLLKQIDEMKKEMEIEVKRQLSLRDAQFYIDNLKLKGDDAKIFKDWFTLTSGGYKRLGQFDYGQPNCTTDHIKTCIQKYNSWIYIGEVKEGTDDTEHGIGIRVWSNGSMIEEGYWKDGWLHGRGRLIDEYGCNYIGEWKESDYNGEGTYYYKGDIQYEGGFKNGDYYGQGTLYTKDGDKYTGIWDGLEGKGEVNYKDGKKYIGQWRAKSGLKRHGYGTLYSADGQVLNQGKWEWDEYKGKE